MDPNIFWNNRDLSKVLNCTLYSHFCFLNCNTNILIPRFHDVIHSFTCNQMPLSHYQHSSLFPHPTWRSWMSAMVIWFHSGLTHRRRNAPVTCWRIWRSWMHRTTTSRASLRATSLWVDDFYYELWWWIAEIKVRANTHINPHFQTMKTLKVLDLKNNPLECNDDFRGTMKFLGTREVSANEPFICDVAKKQS